MAQLNDLLVMGKSNFLSEAKMLHSLSVVNNESNNANDALAYFCHQSNNDWTVKIDSGNYDYGLIVQNSHAAKHALSVTGGARISNTLRIGSTSTTFDSDWCEGVRIGAPDGRWVTIALGTINDSGTNPQCWSIHRTNAGSFSISKNSSDGINGLFMSYDDSTGARMGLGTTWPQKRLHVIGDIMSEGTLFLQRQSGAACGRINFYSYSYNNWVEYMSNRDFGACPTGGIPSELGNVTTWARRSIIENIAGYGWIWESSATTTLVDAVSTSPTPRMALSSNDGTLTITGPIKSSAFPPYWVDACNGRSMINSTLTPGQFSPMLSGGTNNGRMTVAFYTNGLQVTYITRANCEANNNSPAATAMLMDESGGAHWPGLLKQGSTSTDGTISGMNRFQADLFVSGNGSAPNTPRVAGFYLGKSATDENRHMDIVSGDTYAYIDFNKYDDVKDYQVRLIANVVSGLTELTWGGGSDQHFKINGYTTIAQPLTVNARIFGYSYNHGAGKDLPAFIFDKPGANYTGIGACSTNDTIYFGAVNSSSFAWDKTYQQKWVFNGTVTANNHISAYGGLLLSTLNGNTITIGSQNNDWCHIYNSNTIPFIFNEKVFTFKAFCIYEMGSEGVGAAFPSNPQKGQIFFKLI